MAILTDTWDAARIRSGPLRDPGATPMRKQYHVQLTPDQRSEASAVLRRGKAAALTARHARILLEADDAVRRRVRGDRQVAELCGVSPRTVARVRERFARDGFAVALQGRPHPGSAPKLSS